jgi:hypothetical protein
MQTRPARRIFQSIVGRAETFGDRVNRRTERSWTSLTAAGWRIMPAENTAQTHAWKKGGVAVPTPGEGRNIGPASPQAFAGPARLSDISRRRIVFSRERTCKRPPPESSLRWALIAVDLSSYFLFPAILRNTRECQDCSANPPITSGGKRPSPTFPATRAAFQG